MKKAAVSGALVLLRVVACAFASFTSRDADACGGCFVPSESSSVVTDHRMALSVSPGQTTLYDQIKYSGDPASFAWVFLTVGPVTVGLSADTLFNALDQASRVAILPPPLNCPPPPACAGGSSSGGPPPAPG